MPEVKPHAVKKVAIATGDEFFSVADVAWARNGLGFVFGKSDWAERGKAIAQAFGGDAKAAAAAGITLPTFKSQLRRNNAPSNPSEAARGWGLSPGYVETGRPTIGSDLDIESLRLQLARGAFVPAGTTAARRSALRHVVDELRAEIDSARFNPSAADASFSDAPRSHAGMADSADSMLVPALLVATQGQPGLLDGGAPLALSRDWLARHRLDPDAIGVVDLGSYGLFLVDTSPAGHRLVDRCLYAVQEGEGFVVCRWLRDAARLEVAAGPLGIVAQRDPAGVVGRVVFEFRAV